ncbi:MAG TPA: hypothetical protein VHV55_18810 [Pirellulales bacterium]|nr:hypothetical protein [Pirellulales bacterium]
MAYNPLANSIIGGTQNLGVTEQIAQNADQWNTVSVSDPNESVTPTTNLTTVSPIGISGGQVAVAADPGSSNDILYASNDYFNNFFTQNLSSTMTSPPTTSTPTMLVDGSNGQTVYQVEDNLGTGPTFSFQTPIVANADAIAGNKWLVVGSDYVYESFDGGATWTAIQGLSGTGSSAVPVNGVGPVTAMAYGGVYQGNDQGSQYVLWVGSSGSYGLYLRVLQTFTTGNGGTYLNPANVLVPQTSYPGGAVVGIAENPSNWTNTYVADNTNVYLASVPFNGTNTTGNTKFTSLAGPGGGFKISGITYVPLPVSSPNDAIVVSGWSPLSPTNTGVYEILVNKTTGLAAGTWSMVGAPASGVQTGITGQEPQLPHVAVTAITYNATADVLVVTTEGRGVWTLPSFANSNTGYTMSVTGGGTAADVEFVASTTQPGFFTVLFNGVPDTVTISGKAATWPIQLALVQQVNVATTATSNTLDLNFNSTYSNGTFTTASPPVNPIPTGRFIDASTGTSNVIQVEDDTPTIALSGSAGGGSLSLGNSPTTITLQTATTGATLTGGAGNTTFTFNAWSVPATLNGGGGFDTLFYTSNSTAAISYVLTPTQLTQANGGTAINDTLMLNGISAANLVGGSGSNNFDITQWLGSGSIVGGVGSPAGTINSLTDTATVSGAYIYYADGYIQEGMPSNNSLYRPLIALANLQTINLTGTENVNFFDQGWSGTSNLTGGTGNGNAVLVGTTQLNTTFTITDSVITTGTSAVVNILGNIQWYNIFGGPGTNFYNVSGFDLQANLVAGGSGNVLIASEKNNFTLSNSQFLVGSNGTAGSFNLFGITGAVLNTVAGIHTVTVNSWGGGFNLSAGSGADTFILGATGTGTLAGMGPAVIEGGGGSTITLNDMGTTGSGYGGSTLGYWYDMFNNSVEPDGETLRNWYGVTFDSGVTGVTVNGASSTSAKYLVGPSTSTTYNINGNSGNDFLGVLFYGTQSQILTDSPDPSDATKENGSWTFNTATQPVEQKPINFTGINSFNGVTPLVVSGGASSSNASEPLVRVYDASTGKFVDQWDAYPTSFQGGVQVAVGQFLPAQPSTYYVVTAPGPGTPDLVKVWTETGTLVTQFYAFGSSFTGGVNVAVGDVTGDGIPDIVVAQQSGGTAVYVYNGATLNTASPAVSVVTAFSAYGKSLTGGVSVAVAPMKPGATYDDIVTVPYSAAAADVLVFDGLQVAHGGAFYPQANYLALPSNYTLGATVALGDVLGNGQTDIVVAAGVNGSSEIVVTNGASAMSGTSNPSKITTFYAYPTPGASTPTYTSTAEAPVRIALKDILGDGRMELFTAQGAGGDTAGGINVLWGFSGQEIAHLAINSSVQGGLSLG